MKFYKNCNIYKIYKICKFHQIYGDKSPRKKSS